MGGPWAPPSFPTRKRPYTSYDDADIRVSSSSAPYFLQQLSLFEAALGNFPFPPRGDKKKAEEERLKAEELERERVMSLLQLTESLRRNRSRGESYLGSSVTGHNNVATRLLEDPLAALLLNLERQRTDKKLPNELDKMTPEQLKEEKAIIKQELRSFVTAFRKDYGRMVTLPTINPHPFVANATNTPAHSM